MSSGEPSQPLAGRRVYSPGTLAAYTALGNLPLGFILYGLNLKARGRRGLGQSMVCFGAASLAVLIALVANEGVRPFVFLVLSLFGAMNIYQIEQRPFKVALAQGAVPARWWPPAVILIVAIGFFALLDAFL